MLGRSGRMGMAGPSRRGLLGVPRSVVLDPALVRGQAEERHAVGKQRVRDGGDRERPAGEHQRERGGIAPSLRGRASGGAHGPLRSELRACQQTGFKRNLLGRTSVEPG